MEIPEIILEDKSQIKLNAKTFISDLNGGKEMFIDGQVSDLNITSVALIHGWEVLQVMYLLF